MRSIKIQFLVLFIFYFFISFGFNFLGFKDNYANISYFLCGIVFLFLIFHFRYVYKRELPLKKTVLPIIFLPLITFLLKYSMNPYHLNSEVENTISWAMSATLFFVYYYYGFKEKTIMNFMTYICIFGFFTQIYGNIFPNQAVFGVGNADFNQYGSRVRNEIVMFRTIAPQATIFVLYYYWEKMISKITFKNSILFVCMLCSLYLYMTRQLMLVNGMMLVLTFFLRMNKKQNSNFIFLLLVLFTIASLILYYWNAIFGELINDYTSDTYTTDIRGLAIPFFLQQSIGNIPQFLFGHGGDVQEFSYWGELFGYYPDDVGFIGALYKYGLFFVINYFFGIFLILKNRKYIPNYILYFFAATFLDSIFIFPCYMLQPVFVYIVALYIASIHIFNKSK